MSDDETAEVGFTLVELMMAALVLTIVMASLTYVLTNALVDTAYARQRGVAINLANQTVEELRALPWSTLQQGLNTADSTLASDGNVDDGCFDNEPLDVGGTNTSSYTPPCPTPPAWQDPPCLSDSGLSAPPAASGLASPEPLDPHQNCYVEGGTTYGIDVYITWVAGSAVPPISATVVVAWNKSLRSGLDERIVTTTQISNCTVGAACNAGG